MGISAVRALVGLVVAGVVVATAMDDSGGGEGRSSSSRAVVTRVVDGDTVEIASGEHVRIIGIDTPERGDCGYAGATQAMRRMVEGRRVRLRDPAGVQDRDHYDRLLRFVEVGGRDVGLAQVRAGRAVARYDSRDGYDAHPREGRYHRADAASPAAC